MIHRTLLLFAIVLCGCTPEPEQPTRADPAGAAAPTPGAEPPMSDIAEAYVKLVLALGEHDEGYVDAYYGPDAWKAEVQARAPSLEQIGQDATALIRRLGEVDAGADPGANAGADAGVDAATDGAVDAGPDADADMARLRHAYLVRQLQALVARVAMLRGEAMSFDEESRALYDAVAPTHPEQHFQNIVQRLDEALPGDGEVSERYQAWRADFVIPPERLDAVFRAAVEECRRRTAQHIALPEGESFTIEYVTDKPWSGYNWYQGGYRSLIQVNTDLPIFIDRAVDLACHEGYPGHHVYNMLLEQELVNERGWPEFQVYALYSPQSLIAEGTANFGIEVAFPGEERAAYEREVLFPLVGLDPAAADEYYRIQSLVEALGYAGNEAARRYLDGDFDRAQAEAWLVRYALMEPARAAQRVRFIDTYRSYVINYNLGKDLVREHVEAQGGTEASPERRWTVFAELLSSPRLPSGLQRRADSR